MARVEKKIVKKSKHKKAFFWGGLLFMVVGGIVSLLILTFFTTSAVLKRQLASSVSAGVSSKESASLAATTTFLETQAYAYITHLDHHSLSDAITTVEFSKAFLSVSQQKERIKTTTNDLFLSLFQGKKIDTRNTLTSLEDDLNQLTHTITTLQSSQEIALADSSLSTEQKDQLAVELDTAVSSAQSFLQATPLLRSFLTSQDPQTVALLYQDSQELRPTGGFIQSVVFLTIQDGIITDTSFVSSYEVDEALSQTPVAATEEIARFLKEERLYFRDSNWHPDFSQSGEQAMWFLQQFKPADNISLVVGVDTTTLSSIIAALDSVPLPQFNEVITSDNLSERLLSHAQTTLQPTNTTPDYTTALLQAVVQQLSQASEEKVVIILSAFINTLQTKESMVYSPNDELQQTIQSLGFDGSVISPQCPSEFAPPCIVDSMYQVDSNIGINKANEYLHKRINHVVTLQKERVEHERTITYTNTAQVQAWPQGVYQSFVRLYVPKGSILTNVFIDDAPVSYEDMVYYEDKNFQVFGFMMSVPVDTERLVRVTYYETKQTSDAFSYTFFEQKQPGEGSTPFTLSIIESQGQKPVLVAPEAQVFSNSLVFQNEKTDHLFFGVRYE
ncbi:MAG: DUF4012 domain-containing protein [Pseudomonadales bacterium]|nr:DUF4012 domain-containing protein [Pseudomonadales bacterium]